MSYNLKLKLPPPIVEVLVFQKDEIETCAFSVAGDFVVVDLLSVNELFFALKPHLSEFYLKSLKRELVKQLNLKIQRAKKPFSVRVYKDTLDLIEKETYWLDEARAVMTSSPDYSLKPVPTKPDLRLV